MQQSFSRQPRCVGGRRAEQGLPSWENTSGEINLPILLWLHNLLEAWELESYTRARYRLLGSGGHWFAGSNADALDDPFPRVSCWRF